MNKKLSKKEQQIVEFILDYKTYKEIANILHISPRTVEWHVKNIMYKTKCRRKGDIIRKFNHTEHSDNSMFILEPSIYCDAKGSILGYMRRFIMFISKKFH